MTEPTVEVHASTEDLVAAAAARFVAVVTAAQAERGVASVVLTGGGTGIGLLEVVRKAPGGIDWSRLEVFWGDDRFVPAGDAERNDLQARQALLDHVPLDPSRVHPMAASDGEYPDPVEAAAEYSATVHAHLTEYGAFDLHLLGMGGEGHVNSLFPHTDAKSWFDGKSDAELTTIALRNGSLQGAYLLLAARALGLDCGPMSGFDNAKVDAAFFAGTRIRSNFLVNLGRGDPASIFARSPRLGFDEACRIE